MLLFETAAPRPLGRGVFMSIVRIGQTVRSYRSMPDRFVSNIPAFDVDNGPRTASVGVILQEADLRARRSRGNDFHPHPAPCDTRSPAGPSGQRIIRHPIFVVSCRSWVRIPPESRTAAGGRDDRPPFSYPSAAARITARPAGRGRPARPRSGRRSGPA